MKILRVTNKGNELMYERKLKGLFGQDATIVTFKPAGLGFCSKSKIEARFFDTVCISYDYVEFDIDVLLNFEDLDGTEFVKNGGKIISPYVIGSGNNEHVRFYYNVSVLYRDGSFNGYRLFKHVPGRQRESVYNIGDRFITQGLKLIIVVKNVLFTTNGEYYECEFTKSCHRAIFSLDEINICSRIVQVISVKQ